MTDLDQDYQHQLAEYLRLREEWASEMAKADSIAEAGVSTGAFIRQVLDERLHWDRFGRHLPFASDFVRISDDHETIFGRIVDGGLIERYLIELAFAEQFASQSFHDDLAEQALNNLYDSLVASGLTGWASAFASRHYSFAVSQFEKEPAR